MRFFNVLQCVLFCIVFSDKVYTQVELNEISVQNLEVCGQESIFRLKLKNVTDTSLHSISLSIQLRNAVNYKSQSVIGAIDLQNSNLNIPKFRIDSLLPNQEIEISYSVYVSCTFYSELQSNSIELNPFNVYTVEQSSNSFQIGFTGQSYSILYADLSIQVDNSLVPSEVFIGQDFSFQSGHYRKIQILNASQGTVDSLIIRIKPENELTHTRFLTANNAEPIQNVTYTSDGIILILSGSDFLNSGINTGLPNLLEHGELIEIIEEFTISNCSTINDETEYNLGIMCFGITCYPNNPNSLTHSGLNLESGAPLVETGVKELTHANQIANFCNQEARLAFWWVNKGTGHNDFATDLRLEIVSSEQIENTNYNFILTDFELNGIPINEDLYVVSNDLSYPHDETNTPDNDTDCFLNVDGYVFEFQENTNDSFGLLDLDFDGYFDDLASGDSLLMTCKFSFLNDTLNSEACVSSFYSIFGLPQAIYNTNCGTQIKGTSGFRNNFVYDASYILKDQGDIIEPIDFVENTIEKFTFCTPNWNGKLDFFDCELDSHVAVIHLPKGYVLDFSNSPEHHDSILFYQTSTVGTDTMRYAYLEIASDVIILNVGNNNQSSGCYEVPILLNPSLSNEPIPSITNVEWELNYFCDTCSEPMKKACYKQPVYNHVSSNNVGNCGIVSVDFNVKRNSFGWTDHQMLTKVDVSSQGIDLKSAYPFDTIIASLKGKVFSQHVNMAYGTISYRFEQETYFENLYGQVDLISNDTVYTYDVELLQNTVQGSMHVITYQLPSSCLLQMQIGDSLNLKLYLRVKPTAHLNQVNKIEVPDFRSFFSSKIDTLAFETCDNWGDRFSLLSVKTHTRPLRTVNGCDDLDIKLYTWHWGGLFGDDFPNEFRPLNQLFGDIEIVVPQGYFYDGTPAIVYFYPEGENFLSIDTHQIFPVINGNSLFFNSQDFPIIDKSSHVNSQQSGPIFEIKLKTTCERKDTTLTSIKYHYFSNFHTENDTFFVQNHWNVANGFLPIYYDDHDTFNLQFLNYKPNLSINVSGNQTQMALENTVSWDVEVCNKSDSSHLLVGNSEFTWLEIENAIGNLGFIAINEALLLSTNLTLPIQLDSTSNKYLVDMSTIDKNTCKTIRLNADFNFCDETVIDTIKIKCKTSCNSLFVSNVHCDESNVELYLQYKRANLQFQQLDVPFHPQFCDTFTYEFQLTNSGIANLYDLNFWMNLPSGFELVESAYAYPVYGDWNNLTEESPLFLLDENIIGWNFTEQIPNLVLQNNSLVGSRKPDENNIWIRIRYKLNCQNMDLNTSYSVHVKGVSNCKDTMNYTSVFPTNSLEMENLTSYSLTNLTLDSLVCTNKEIRFSLKNESNQPNQPGDTLKFSTPNGIYIVNSNGFNSYIFQNNQLVLFPIPILGSNDSIEFRLNVETNLQVNDCFSVAFPVEINRKIAISCIDSCQLNSTILDTIQTSFCCKTCNLNADFISDTICEDEMFCFNTINNTFLNNYYNHQWLIEGTEMANEHQFCTSFENAGNYLITHVVSNSSNTCFSFKSKNVYVQPKPIGEIVVVGCTPFWEGDSIILHADGQFSNAVWSLNNEFISNNDSIVVYTPGNYTVELSTGTCENLSITKNIQMLEAQELTLNDVFICDSSELVVLDAGSNYTTFSWSTGATTQTIQVGEGVYWVEVSQMLPHVYCIYKSTDTIKVIASHLKSTTSDYFVCEGASIDVQASVSGGVLPYSYFWNGVNLSSEIGVTEGVYNLRVSDSIGCEIEDTVSVFSVPNTYNGFVLPDTVIFMDSICVPVIPFWNNEWYVYDENDSILQYVSSQDATCLSFDSLGNFMLMHVIENACKTDTMYSDITVLNTVNSCIQVIGNSTFCQGDTVKLTLLDNVDNDFVYWFKDSELIAFSDTLDVTESGVYSFSYTNQQVTSETCFSTELVRIDQIQLLTMDTLTLCNSSDSINILIDQGYTNYSWFYNEMPLLNQHSNHLIVSNSGIYEIQVETENACLFRDSVIVKLREALSFPMQIHTICVNQQLTLSVPCTSQYEYTWYKKHIGTNQLSILPNSSCNLSLLHNTSGKFYYVAVIENTITGCIDTMEFVVKVVLGPCKFGIAVFPNPVLEKTEFVSIFGIEEYHGDFHVEILDARGQLVQIDHFLDPSNFLRVNISRLIPGIYLIRLFKENELLLNEKLNISN